MIAQTPLRIHYDRAGRLSVHYDKEFEEKHPRGRGGKFAPKGTARQASPPPEPTPPDRPRRWTESITVARRLAPRIAAEIRAAGVEPIRRRVLASAGKISRLRAEHDRLRAEQRRLGPLTLENPALRPEFERVRDRRLALAREIGVARAEPAEALVEALARGPAVPVQLRPVATFAPAVQDQIRRAGAWVGEVLRQRGGERLDVEVGNSPPADSPDRSVYRPEKGRVELAVGAPSRTIVHEIGHAIENKVPGVREACLAFLRHRIGDEAPKPLRDFSPDFEPHERGCDDEFGRAFSPRDARYTGRIYFGGQTEVLAMGLEKLFTEPEVLAERDPEYFDFLVGVLAGRLRF